MLSRSVARALSRACQASVPGLEPACLINVKGYAEAATAEASAPPLKLPGEAGRLASAIWTAAAGAKQLPQVQRDFSTLSALTGNVEFRNFLEDPFMPIAEKQSKLEQVIGSIKASAITKNLVLMLADENRTRMLLPIMKRFNELVSAAKGEIEAVVTTAKPLPAQEQQEIQKAMRDLVQPGQSLKVTIQEDPSIIGGLVFQIGDRLIDCSIRTRMSELERMILDTA